MRTCSHLIPQAATTLLLGARFLSSFTNASTSCSTFEDHADVSKRELSIVLCSERQVTTLYLALYHAPILV